MKKEVFVQMFIALAGFLVGSLWPLWIWMGLLFAGGTLFKDWWWIATQWSLAGPVVLSLLYAVIPMPRHRKMAFIMALLTPAILLSLYH
jgi:hypothetical protein